MTALGCPLPSGAAMRLRGFPPFPFALHGAMVWVVSPWCASAPRCPRCSLAPVPWRLGTDASLLRLRSPRGEVVSSLSGQVVCSGAAPFSLWAFAWRWEGSLAALTPAYISCAQVFLLCFTTFPARWDTLTLIIYTYHTVSGISIVSITVLVLIFLHVIRFHPFSWAIGHSIVTPATYLLRFSNFTSLNVSSLVAANALSIFNVHTLILTLSSFIFIFAFYPPLTFDWLPQ